MATALRAMSGASVFGNSTLVGQMRSRTGSDVFTQYRVIVQRQVESAWHKQLESRFEQLMNLPQGWDGYAGRALSFNIARFAADLLNRICDPSVPAPSLVPGSDGTLQIEWHRGGYDIEIDIVAPAEIRAYRHKIEDGSEDEKSLGSDVTILASWVKDMAQAVR